MIPANPWMDIARSLVGLREIPGPTTAPQIDKMLRRLHSWYFDDETPWCGTTVGYCLAEAGLAYPKAWYRAKAYAEWGVDPRPFGTVAEIPFGAIVVLSRAGGGHVGFYCGPSGSGFAMLGGNQNNEVNVSSYLWSRIIAVRWPSEHAVPPRPYSYPSLGEIRASTSDA